MAVGIRKRFEVFKRDGFTCRYCGRKSPEVVLEADHVIPVAEGGTDDEVNLVTACWECNRGKGAVPLRDAMTGEDPHDKAILLLERERQLREYNKVLAVVNERIETEASALEKYWNGQVYASQRIGDRDASWLIHTLETTPAETIRQAMAEAIRYGKTSGLAYVVAILRNKRQRGEL
jgi:hypothetical protein